MAHPNRGLGWTSQCQEDGYVYGIDDLTVGRQSNHGATRRYPQRRCSMNAIGSFHPLIAEDAEAEPVLFVFAANTLTQRRAIHDEALHRLSAATALSDALMTAKVEAHGPWSHTVLLEAVHILARDAQGLLSTLSPES